AGDARSERRAAADLAEPVHAHGIEEVVEQVVRDLVARLAPRARPGDVARVADRALEAAVLLAHVGDGVVDRPVVALAERLRRDPDAQLLRLAPQVAAQLLHAVVLLAHARVARGDGPGRGDD